MLSSLPDIDKLAKYFIGYNNPDDLETVFCHPWTSPEPIYPEFWDKDKTPSCHAPGQLCNVDQSTAANNKVIVLM